MFTQAGVLAARTRPKKKLSVSAFTSLTKRLTLLAAMFLLSGCVALQAVQTATSLGSLLYAREAAVVASECELFKPIYLDGDVTGLTDKDLRAIVLHNEIYEQSCR